MNGLGEIQTEKWIGPRMILNVGMYLTMHDFLQNLQQDV